MLETTHGSPELIRTATPERSHACHRPLDTVPTPRAFLPAWQAVAVTGAISYAYLIAGLLHQNRK